MEEATEKALQYAKANKSYSRLKECSFEVKEKDIVAKPDWQVSSRPCRVMQGESEKSMEKYKIVFDDGNVRMLCALDQTYEERKKS